MDCSPLSSFTVPLSVRETTVASITARDSRTSWRSAVGEGVLPLCKMVCRKGGACLSPSSSTEPLGEVGLAFAVQLHFPGLSFHPATGNNFPSPKDSAYRVPEWETDRLLFPNTRMTYLSAHWVCLSGLRHVGSLDELCSLSTRALRCSLGRNLQGDYSHICMETEAIIKRKDEI